MALTDYVNPFIDQSQYGLSPEAIAARRRYAYGLLQQAGSGEPTKANAIGAIARALQGTLGGAMVGEAEKSERQGLSANADMLAGMFGGGPQAASGAAPPAAAPMPAPAPADGTVGAFQGNPQLAARFGNFQQGPIPGSSMPAASLPRGLRNNNPLNIEAGDFTQSQPGFAGSDGRFAKFQSPGQGMQAANTLLDSYAKRGLTTPAAIVARWAPAGDGNNVQAYAADIAAKLGIGPNDQIPPAMRPQLIAAMAAHENGQTMSPATVAQALQGGQQLAGPIPMPNTAPAIPAPQPPTPAVSPQAPQGGMLQSPQIQKLISVARDQTANPYQRQFATKMLEGIVQKQLSGEWKPVARPDGSIALVNSATGEVHDNYNPDVGKRIAEQAGQKTTAEETAKLGVVKEPLGKLNAGITSDLPVKISDALTALDNGMTPITGPVGAKLSTYAGTPAANHRVLLNEIESALTSQYINDVKQTQGPQGRGASPEQIAQFKAGLGLQTFDGAQLRQNLQRLQKQYGQPQQAQSVQSAQTIQEGATATNPKTGAKIIFKGGKWEPAA